MSRRPDKKRRPLYYKPPEHHIIPGVPLRELSYAEFAALPEHLRVLAEKYYTPVYRENGDSRDGGND